MSVLTIDGVNIEDLCSDEVLERCAYAFCKAAGYSTEMLDAYPELVAEAMRMTMRAFRQVASEKAARKVH